MKKMSLHIDTLLSLVALLIWWCNLVCTSGIQATEQSITPPLITMQSPSLTVATGSSVTLSMTATGTGPLTYKWLMNGTNLSNETNSTLTLSLAHAKDSGSYRVVVKNNGGAVTSTVVRVEVNNLNPSATPIMLTGWNADVVSENSPVPLSEPFAGPGTTPCWFESGLEGYEDGLPRSRKFTSSIDESVSYQFQAYTDQNVLMMTRQTDSQSGTLNLVDPQMYRRLYILASSGAGSGFGTLVLHFLDGTSSQPLSFFARDYFAGTNEYTGRFERRPAISGLGRNINANQRLLYNDGGLFGFEMSQTDLDLDVLGFAQKKLVGITFTKPGGSGTPFSTCVFAISGVSYPTITTQPQSQIVTEGDDVTLNISTVNGSRFQWLLNSAILTEATNATLILHNVTLDQTGNYSVRVSNSSGNVTSSSVKITVLASVNKPFYNNDFENSIGTEWSYRTLSSTPNGNRRFLGRFANQTTRLTLTNLPPHTGVNLAFDLFIIRSWDGNETTVGPDTWSLKCIGGPTLLNTTFSSWGASQAYPENYPGGIFPGQTGAAEVGTLGYLWGTQDWDAAYSLNYQFAHYSNSLTLEFSAIGLETLDNESWGIDNVVVSTGNVPANAPPTITSLPKTQIVRTGDTATFIIAATPSSTLSYQWKFNGQNINGATNALLALTKVTDAQAGSYSASVSNPFGSITRTSAYLVVLSGQPKGKTVNAGETATFSVKASGPSLKYQWQFNGQDVPNATYSTLTLSNAQPAQAGYYTVLVANGDISLMSEAAALSVPLPGQPGSKIWEFTAENSIRTTPAIGADGTIYFGDYNGFLYALNPDGTKIWSCALGYWIMASPSIGIDGTIYVVADSQVFAINANGTIKWVFATPSDNYSSPAIGSDGTIYFGLCNSTNMFYALNPDGTKKWEFVAGSRIFSSPAIGFDGTIYFGNLDNNKVFALYPDGTKKWELTLSAVSGVYSSPAIGADGTIYIGSNDGNLYAINPDGTKKWEFKTNGPIGSAPSIGKDGTIYFGSEDGFYAINPDKSIKWKFTASETFFTSCSAVSDQGTVYFQNDRNKLYAFSSDGIKKWEFATGGQFAYELRAGPTIAKNGTVYFGANDSKLYAIKGDSGPADSPWPMFLRDLNHTARVRAIAKPQNVSVSAGANPTFSVQTTETKSIIYQWLFNGTPLTGATNASLTLSNITTSQVGNYTVVVTQDGMSQTFSSMSLAVDPTFTKITLGNIVNDNGDSVGCAWGDYDNDGFLDLVVANAALQNEFLYHNDGNGTFTKVTTGPVVNSGENSTSPAWADYDNNGTLDLFIANYDHIQPSFLFQNVGNGAFLRVTNTINVANLSGGCAWADYDGDGNLDLFIANDTTNGNYLYHGNGDGTFDRVTSGTIATDRLITSYDSVWGDFNNDGKPDLFLTSGGGDNALYRNEGNGEFTRITAGIVVNDGSSLGAAWGDYDNDGNLDLVTTRGSDVRLYHNNGSGGFTKTVLANPGKILAGCAWGDYDNDGFLDLFLTDASGQNNVLYHNNGNGAFSKITSGSLVNDGGHSWSAAWGDYDNDGFLDLFVCNRLGETGFENNFLYRNNGNTNNWLKVKLIGTSSNRSGIGAKVRLKAVIKGREMWQLREVASGGSFGQASLNIHFGLGDVTKVEALRIEWPSGIVQELSNLVVDRFLTITESPLLSVEQGWIPEGFELILTSRGGFSYDIEWSSDLINWFKLKTVTGVNGSIQVLDTTTSAYTTRFYRATQQSLAPDPLNMVWIGPGTFTMGSPTNEVDRRLSEGPQTQVTISHGYWMSKYETTQGEYQAVMGDNPSWFKGNNNHPVEYVTWDDAANFCDKLTARERFAGRLPAGYAYRLPTEAEWEYACRAGTTTRFSYGDDLDYTQLGDYAWYWNNSYTTSKPSGVSYEGGGRYYTTHPVGQKQSNAWGLYDMHGNVFEWCLDWWSDSLHGGSVTDPRGPNAGSARVLRGGNWGDQGIYCRAASRDSRWPDSGYYALGFRPVLAPGQ